MKDYTAEVSDYVWGQTSEVPKNLIAPKQIIQDDVAQFQQFYDFLQSTNSLPFHLFSGNFMAEFRAKVTHKATRLGYELFSVVEKDTYHSPVSYLVTEDQQLLLVVHLPALNLAKAYTVYRPFPVPVALPKDHELFSDETGFLLPLVDGELVIVSAETSARQIFPDKLNMESCGAPAHRWALCEDFFLRNQPMNTSCLETLIKEDHGTLRTNCKFATMPMKDWEMVVGEGERLIFTTNEKSNVICNGKTLVATNTVVPNVTQMVRLPVGCGLELESESLWSGFHRPSDRLEMMVKMSLDTFVRIKPTMTIQTVIAFFERVFTGLMGTACSSPTSTGFTVGIMALYNYGAYARDRDLRRLEQAQLQAQLQAILVLGRRRYG